MTQIRPVRSAARGAFAALAVLAALHAPAALRQVVPEAASASSSYDTRVPGNAVDGSGLTKYARDGWKFWSHSTVQNSDMWMSAKDDTNGWFVVKFTNATHLAQMKVWNFNMNNYVSRGVKSADIYVSTSLEAMSSGTPNLADTAVWSNVVGGVTFSQASGSSSYVGDNVNVVALGGAEALYLALDIKGTHAGGSSDYAGLSEIVFWENAETPDPETVVPGDGVTTPLKVLAIGNSFSRSAYVHLPAIATAAGKKLDLLNLYYGGCSLQQHWEHHDATSFYQGFDKSVTSSSSPIGAMTKDNATLDDILSAEHWDIVTLQQNSANSATLSTYEPYFGNLVALIRARAPSARIWIHQTWSWAEPKTDSSDTMYDSLKANYDAMQATYELPNLMPVGYAVQLCRHKLDFNPVASDNQHLSAPQGEYMQGCVWAEELFGIDATTISYVPSGISPDLAADLRDVAHEACGASDLSDYGKYDTARTFEFPVFGTAESGMYGRTYPVIADGVVKQVVEFSETVHTWSFTMPADASSVEYLAVGGGGSGGTCDGGGGAGGRFLSGTLSAVGGAEASVKVGAGGIAVGKKGESTRHRGLPGGMTTLQVGETVLEAAGGGGGGAYQWNGTDDLGVGENGGGDAYSKQVGSTGPNGTKGGTSGGATSAGGGAGAGGDGGNGPGGNVGGAGGVGVASSITGTTRYYAAGGGGGVGGDGSSSSPGLGGSGVGGNGGRSYQSEYATSGVDGTGSGGGGGGRDKICLAGNGGSGTVVLRYVVPSDLRVCTVQFLGKDGETLKTETLISGTDATPPAPPEYEGFLFSGWSADVKAVASDMVVRAIYMEGSETDYGTSCVFTDDYGVRYHVETFSKTGETLSFTLPDGAFLSDLLVVGGGGGGGGEGGGGGGAVYSRFGVQMSAGEYEITVGTGGNGATPFNAGANGGASSVTGPGGFSVTALGGGGGSGWSALGPSDGANGGGGSPTTNGTQPPSAGTAPADEWHHQGFTGGTATNTGSSGTGCGGAGGGAGAGADGGDSLVLGTAANNDPTVESAGRGGDGWVCDITGAPVYYAGGGGGGVRRSNYKIGGAGGLGGGGSGATAIVDAEGNPTGAGITAGTAGVDGLGGGGGGGGWNKDGGDGVAGKKGGSGVVVLRYMLRSENEDRIFTVRFVDGETVLKEEEVLAGRAAEPPEAPIRANRAFIGWSADVSSVKADMTVSPRYSSEFEPTAWGYTYTGTRSCAKFMVSVVTNTSQTWTIPAAPRAKFDVLLVGGGAGGGGLGGGGGGAVYYRKGLVMPQGSFSVTVGKGGAGATEKSGTAAPHLVGTNGGTTTLSASGLEIEAVGGRTGRGWKKGQTIPAGANGGGGSPTNEDDGSPNVGTAPADEWHHQGFTGGRATNTGSSGTGCGGAGGGAGAGADGGDSFVLNTAANNDPTVESAGRGGDGWCCDITGSPVYYAGGGGGGIRRSNYKLGGAGGLGGGGSGSTAIVDAQGVPTGAGITMGTPGVDGLGGGGGGGGWDKDGGSVRGTNGGSGVVILRWSLPGPFLMVVQ